jgi:hypothetical protein
MNFPHPVRRFLEILGREKKSLIQELVQVQGLMPLMMKKRNGGRWTQQDKGELVAHFKRLSRISRYVAVAALPGGLALLPLLAWWLDQRRARRAPPPG